MKIAPVSADLIIKLALVAGGVIAVVWAFRKASSAAGEAVSGAWTGVVDGVAAGTHAIDPRNDENIIYRGVNVITGGNDSNSLGGRIADFFHPVKF